MRMPSDELELSAARLLWDLEEAGVTASNPTLTFSWCGGWREHSGRFLTIRRLVHHMVTVSWRYGRPPRRPSEDLSWDGEQWRPRLVGAENQEAPG